MTSLARQALAAGAAGTLVLATWVAGTGASAAAIADIDNGPTVTSSAKKSGVKISKLKFHKKKRTVTATVGWDTKLMNAAGLDHFTVRLLAEEVNEAAAAPLLLHAKTGKSAPSTQKVSIKLSKTKAKKAKAAKRLVLSVTQKWQKNKKAKFTKGYVGVKKLDLTKKSAQVSAIRNCDRVLIKQRANAVDCDLTGGELTNFNLAHADFSNAILARGSIRGSIIRGTKFAGANFAGTVVKGTSGTPASSPNGFQFTDGGLQKKTYAVGETGPGGGTVYYVAPTQQHWGKYIEIAPKTWGGDAASEPWCPIGEPGINTLIGTSKELGSAVTNTNLIIEKCGSESFASLVRSYQGNLPAGSWSMASVGDLEAIPANLSEALIGNIQVPSSELTATGFPTCSRDSESGVVQCSTIGGSFKGNGVSTQLAIPVHYF